ncbi:hypothetical protein BLS_006541 [Venturia inaequalis]|uniref:NAD(P)-binding protein n=1 Tax=Venturia inaequalis TaxID=5025 RepID=A0A8H3UD92_VENIN|nr:hypothetical protein BLS_006541 [Venturia inaequalis]
MSTEALPKRPANSGAQFCPPQHHSPEGPTDPVNTKLPPNFTVLVAGGSRGIGLGIAQSYALANVTNLIISSRTLSTCEDAARSIVKLNPRVKILCQECDVTSDQQVQDLVEAVRKGFGRLDVLVINAGSSTALTEVREGGLKDWPRGMIEGPSNELERLWKINVNAAFLLQHYFLPLLEETRDVLIDSPSLCGGFLVWLTKEKRQWLSGRYLDARWDIPTLLSKKEEITSKDLLKLRMALD